MTQHNDCNEILDLIPEYAFGLTDEMTSRRIEAALPTCPEAAQQLAEFRRLQADMLENVPQIAPHPALAHRLRETIAKESTPAPSTVLRPPTEHPRGVIVMPDVKRSRAAHQRTSSRPASSPLPPSPLPQRRSNILPLVAVAALIALVATNIYWFGRVNTMSTQMRDATTLLAQFQGDVFSVRNIDTLETARLSDSGQDGFAMVMWDQDSQTGLVYARDLPDVDPGREYQLWLLRGDETVSGGTFTLTENGEGALIFTAPESITNFEAAGITDEPAGGSEAPTSAPIVSGAL